MHSGHCTAFCYCTRKSGATANTFYFFKFFFNIHNSWIQVHLQFRYNVYDVSLCILIRWKSGCTVLSGTFLTVQSRLFGYPVTVFTAHNMISSGVLPFWFLMCVRILKLRCKHKEPSLQVALSFYSDWLLFLHYSVSSSEHVINNLIIALLKNSKFRYI
jgi:hypothetical protein